MPNYEQKARLPGLAKINFGKKEPRRRGEHDYSVRLEATKKDGVQTGETPRPNVR